MPRRFAHAPCSVLDREPCTPYVLQRVQPRALHSSIDYPTAEPATDGPDRAAGRTSGEIPEAGPRPRYHRRSLCGAALLLGAAAGRHRARGHADVGALQLQEDGRDHRRAAGDLCHRGRPGRYPRRPTSTRSMHRSTACHAAEIHRQASAARSRGGRSPSATSTTASWASMRGSRDAGRPRARIALRAHSMLRRLARRAGRAREDIVGLLVLILGLMLFLGVHTLTTQREVRAQVIARDRRGRLQDRLCAGLARWPRR